MLFKGRPVRQSSCLSPAPQHVGSWGKLPSTEPAWAGDPGSIPREETGKKAQRKSASVRDAELRQ